MSLFGRGPCLGLASAMTAGQARPAMIAILPAGDGPPCLLRLTVTGDGQPRPAPDPIRASRQ